MNYISSQSEISTCPKEKARNQTYTIKKAYRSSPFWFETLFDKVGKLLWIKFSSLTVIKCCNVLASKIKTESNSQSTSYHFEKGEHIRTKSQRSWNYFTLARDYESPYIEVSNGKTNKYSPSLRNQLCYNTRSSWLEALFLQVRILRKISHVKA